LEPGSVVELEEADHGLQLAGDNGEAITVFAGAGGLDRGVEREQVGLANDLLDHADLVGNALHRRQVSVTAVPLL
jgi:hypothetical protein